MLEINGLLKIAEVDIFAEGCQPDTSQMYGVDVDFKAETQAELIGKVCDFLDIEDNKENYLLNSCDEQGRIDFQLLEDGEGVSASKEEIRRWKKGACQLWAVTYSAQVEKVEREAFALAE